LMIRCPMQESSTSKAPTHYRTLEIKISFMRPAFVGPLFGTGRLVHRGRDFAFLEGSLRDKDAKLIATATASARIIAIEELRARLVGKEARRNAS
jgi:uncharacterized protein (TIGR00369 family)